MSEQTLKFSDIVVNKREFHASKQVIASNLVNTNKIVVSDKFKHSDDGFKYFIGCLHDDDVIKPLCIILPQIPYFLQFSFQIVITFHLIFLPLFNSAIKGTCKVSNFALI